MSAAELDAIAAQARRAYEKWLALDGSMAACEAAGVCVNDVPRLVKALREANANLDHIRRAVAVLAGADPETWPDHGNAPLAIAAWLELARIRKAESASRMDTRDAFAETLADKVQRSLEAAMDSAGVHDPDIRDAVLGTAGELAGEVLDDVLNHPASVRPLCAHCGRAAWMHTDGYCDFGAGTAWAPGSYV
jgi:N-acetylglucosamine kinase-like BadF-type ATPase